MQDLYMLRYFSLFFLIALLFTSCDKSTDTPVTEDKGLTLVSSKTIDIPEPSDLALSYDKKSLWTVSDSTGNIYRLSLDGTVEKELTVEGNDPEGITVISSQVLAVVFENKSHIVFYDTSGNKLKTADLDISSDINVGLEGITYNQNTGHYFLVNENNPTAIIEADADFNIVNTIELDISTDLSGIYYESNENVFWIISHESKLLAKFDTSFNLLKSYSIPLQQGEGVSVDYANKRIYLVSDKDSKFYVYGWE
jgi:uncharacterized protein YjiK